MDINLEIGGSSEKLLSQLKELRAELQAQVKELEAIKKANQESAREGIAGTEQWIKKEMELNKQLEMQRNLVSQLQKDMKSQASMQDQANKNYQDSIKKLKGELDGLRNSSKQVSESNKEIGASATIAGRGISSMITKLVSMAGIAPMVALGAIAFKSLKEAATDFYNYLTKEQQKRERTQKDILELNKSTEKGYVEEKIKLEALLTVARSETATKEAKAKAIKGINDLMPEYNNGITQENINNEAVNKQTDAYLLKLQAKAKGQTYMAKIQAAYVKLIDIENSSLEENIKWYEQGINALRSFGNQAEGAALNAVTAFQNRDKAKKDAKEYADELVNGLTKALEDGSATITDEEKKNGKKQTEIRLREFKDRSNQIIALEKQLAEARIAAMQDGREKEIASENARYDALVKSAIQKAADYESEISKVRQSKNLSNADKIKEIQQLEQLILLEYDVIEQAEETHTSKLLAIDLKYYEESKKALEDSQRAVNDIILKDKDKELNALERKYSDLIKKLEEARNKAIALTTDPSQLSGIDNTYNANITALTDSREKERNDIIKKWKLKNIKEEEDYQIAVAGVLQKDGLKAEQIERLRQAARLQVQIEFAQKRIDLLKDSTSQEDQTMVAQLQAQIEKYKLELQKLGEKNKKDFNIYSLLGLNISKQDERYLDQAMRSIADSVFTIWKENVDRRVDEHRRILDALQDEISAQERFVDEQKALSEKGLANNLDIAQRELDDMKRRNNEQVEEMKRLEKQQMEYAKAQQIISGIATAAKLGGAAAEVFSAHAGIPFVGVALAAAAVATMLATFASVKNQTKQLSNYQTYRGGGDFDATGANMPTHERGGIDVMINGEKKAEFEKGEYAYFFKDGKTAKRFKPLFDDINDGQLSKWHVAPAGIMFPEQTMKNIVVNNVVDKGSDKYLKKISNNVDKIANSETVEYKDGMKIIKKGNLIRKIKNG